MKILVSTDHWENLLTLYKIVELRNKEFISYLIFVECTQITHMKCKFL